MVQNIKDIYDKETNFVHKEYSLEEIKKIFLDQFNEFDYAFMEKFFRRFNPEKEMQILMKKNSELTQIMINRDKKEEEKKEKEEEIYKEINNLKLTEEKKN